MSAGNPRAVILTGVYGAGKTSVAEEIVDLLEHRSLPYALLDLDYLMWFDTGQDQEPADPLRLANVRAVVGNYLAAGIRYFVLAGAFRDLAELEAMKAELRMPVSVVRLTAPFPEIDRRLRANVTTARSRDDLPVAAAWIAASTGEGIEDLAVANDRPIREVATEIVEWLGW